MKLKFLLLVILMSSVTLAQAKERAIYNLAFIASDGWAETYESNLFVVQSDGNNLKKLTAAETCWQECVSWSPGGEWITYTHNGDLYRIRRDGTDNRLIIDNYDLLELVWNDNGLDTTTIPDLRQDIPYLNPFEKVVWSPDGDSLFLLLWQSPGYSGSRKNLYSIGVTGDNFHRIYDTESEIFAVADFDVIPEQNKLIFVIASLCRYCTFTGGAIASVDFDGSNYQLLTPGKQPGAYELQTWYPMWSQARGLLYFIDIPEYESDTWYIKTMQMNGNVTGSVAQIDTCCPSQPALLSDYILYNTRTGIYHSDYDGKNPTYIFLNGVAGTLTVSPTGDVAAGNIDFYDDNLISYVTINLIDPELDFAHDNG